MNSEKEPSIDTRCSVKTAMEFLHSTVFPNLKREHSKLLAKTPFFLLLTLDKNTQLCRPILHNILLRWDLEKGAFSHHNKLIPLTVGDISLVMGFSTGGDTVQFKCDNDVPTRSMLREKYFIPTGEISRNALEDKIKELLGAEIPVPENDIVGLIIMYLFTMILFPQSTGSVQGKLFHYLDDVESLKKYDWGRAVYDKLILHVPKCAAWCQKKTSDKINGSNRRYFAACSFALLTWFFEYFPIGGDYRKGSGGVPRCHNWDLSNSSRVITFSKMIERIPEGRVCEKLTRTPEERKYQEIKFLAVDHIDLVRTVEGLTKPENKMLKNLLVEMAPN